MEDFEDGLIDAVAGFEAVGGAGYVANEDVGTGGGGAEVDAGFGGELFEAMLAGGALPFLLGDGGVFLGFLEDDLVDALDEVVGVVG